MSIRNSEVPEGFKMTGIGILPQEWRTEKLFYLLEEKTSKNRSHEQLPVYSVSNVYGFILSDEFFDKQVYSRDLGTYKVIQRRYFAYNPYRVNVGSLGVFEREGKGLVSPAYIVFEISRPDVLDRKFFYLLLKSDRYVELIKKYSMSRGSVRRSLSFKDLSAFEIPLPPLPVQKAIARVLSTIQKAIETQDKILAAARELKRSLMRHLFTYGPVPFPEADKVPLKETEIGLVPEHWQVVRLGEILDSGSGSIQTGPFGSLLHASDYLENGIPFVMPVNLDSRGRIISDGVARIGRENWRRLARYHIQTGDVLLARRGEIGRRGVVTARESGWVCGSGCLRIRPGDLVHTQFLSTAFETDPLRKWLSTNAIGTTMANLNTQILNSMPVPLPPQSEQTEIAAILLTVDYKFEATQIYKSALQTLFKTMLHHLMTGKVRVKDLEVSAS
jgi:type I restriction enzyme, S subunit